MKKLKVGDKVLVKTYEQLKALKNIKVNEDKLYDPIANNDIVEDMFYLCGTIATISKIKKSKIKNRILYVIKENTFYVWDYRWLIPLKTPAAQILFKD